MRALLIAALLGLAAACTPPAATTTETPEAPAAPSADATTEALLTVLTPVIAQEIGKPVSLQTTHVNVRDEWAFVIAQPRSVFANEHSRVHYDGGAFHYAGLIALRNFYVPISEAVGQGVVSVDCAVAVALLVDRAALLEAGGYDETMFILFEDLDLSFRLRAMGRRIVSVEDALVLHKGGTAGISFREGPSYPGSRVFFHSRNRWTYMAKCLRWRTLVVAFPGIALYELVWFGFACVSLAPHQWLRGKWRFVRLCGHVRRERARFQALRTVPDRELLVGGPFTVTPSLKSGGPKRLVLRALDLVLALWWSIVRRIAG